METTPTYSFDELCALVEVPARTVRYYIQLGLVDRPDGANRGARYGARHIEQLLTIRKWQSVGFSLERIRELLEAPEGNAPPPRKRGAGTIEVWSHLIVGDGVELHVESGVAGLTPEEVREFYRGVMAQFEAIRARRNQNQNDKMGNEND